MRGGILREGRRSCQVGTIQLEAEGVRDWKWGGKDGE